MWAEVVAASVEVASAAAGAQVLVPLPAVVLPDPVPGLAPAVLVPVLVLHRDAVGRALAPRVQVPRWALFPLLAPLLLALLASVLVAPAVPGLVALVQAAPAPVRHLPSPRWSSAARARNSLQAAKPA